MKVSDKAMQPSVSWKYLKYEMCKRFEVAGPIHDFLQHFNEPGIKLVGGNFARLALCCIKTKFSE